MKLKWYGVLLLLLDLVLMIPKYSPAAGLVIATVGVLFVVIDCRKDDKEYVKKRQEEITKQKIEGE